MDSFPVNKVGHREIYKRFPKHYDSFMKAHDCDEKVKEAIIHRVRPHNVIIDAGCGTGRITKIVAPLVKEVYAFDQSPAMIDYLRPRALSNVICNTCTLGDESIPNFNAADYKEESPVIIIVAWSLCCVKQSHWNNNAWKPIVDRIITTWIHRFKPEKIIVLENLGTGVKTQSRKGDIVECVKFFVNPPLHIRTDYSFPSYNEALEKLTFFYGRKVAEQFIKTSSWLNNKDRLVIPEVTGVYIYESVHALVHK